MAWEYQSNATQSDKIFNNKNVSEPYITGGGEEGGYDPKRDRDLNIYLKNITVFDEMQNVSVINNYSKLHSTNNIYTVKPNSADYSNLDKLTFIYGFCGKDGNGTTNEQKYDIDLYNFTSQNCCNYYFRNGYDVDCSGSWWYSIFGYDNYDDVKYKPTHIYVNGIRVEKSGNKLTFIPYLYVEYQSVQGFKSSGHFAFSSKGTYSYTLPDIPDAPTFYSVNQIKTAELGENFVVDGKINNGLPYLKAFYW